MTTKTRSFNILLLSLLLITMIAAGSLYAARPADDRGKPLRFSAEDGDRFHRDMVRHFLFKACERCGLHNDSGRCTRLARTRDWHLDPQFRLPERCPP